MVSAYTRALVLYLPDGKKASLFSVFLKKCDFYRDTGTAGRRGRRPLRVLIRRAIADRPYEMGARGRRAVEGAGPYGARDFPS